MGHVDTSIPNNVVILHLDLLLTLVYFQSPPVVTIMGHVDTSIPNNCHFTFRPPPDPSVLVRRPDSSNNHGSCRY